MKIYFADRKKYGHKVLVIQKNSSNFLRPRNDLFNHSLDGFNWGYGGSGPAQLALALLVDCLQDDQKAIKYYQDFKWIIISKLQFNGWSLREDQIKAIIEEIERNYLKKGY